MNNLFLLAYLCLLYTSDAYFVGFILLLSLLGYVVVLQHHIFLCHIAEPGGFGAVSYTHLLDYQFRILPF